MHSLISVCYSMHTCSAVFVFPVMYETERKADKKKQRENERERVGVCVTNECDEVCFFSTRPCGLDRGLLFLW